MALEEKYLTEDKMGNQLKDILKAADKLVTENMNLVSKHTNQIMKKVEKKYIKDPDNSMSPKAAKDIFLSNYTKSIENYINGIVKSIGK